jgi:hypothetical protein
MRALVPTHPDFPAPQLPPLLPQRKQACLPEGKSVAEATCRRVSGSRNWYDVADVTVKVDKKDAYAKCCAECTARAQNKTAGCVAFSVNSWCAR